MHRGDRSTFHPTGPRQLLRDARVRACRMRLLHGIRIDGERQRLYIIHVFVTRRGVRDGFKKRILRESATRYLFIRQVKRLSDRLHTCNGEDFGRGCTATTVSIYVAGTSIRRVTHRVLCRCYCRICAPAVGCVWPNTLFVHVSVWYAHLTITRGLMCTKYTQWIHNIPLWYCNVHIIPHIHCGDATG